MTAKKRASLSERMEIDQASKPVDMLFGKTSTPDHAQSEEEVSNLSESEPTTEKPIRTIDQIIIPKEKEEVRDKRVSFLLQPSVYKKAQKKCKSMGISVNECINQFLINWVDDK